MNVIVSMFVSSVVDNWFKTGTSQTKDYDICICGFIAKDHNIQAAVRTQNEDNNISNGRLLFIRVGTIPYKQIN